MSDLLEAVPREIDRPRVPTQKICAALQVGLVDEMLGLSLSLN